MRRQDRQDVPRRLGVLSDNPVAVLAHDGEWETIVSGLDFPSALTLGPDGAFCISECGYHCAQGAGRILRDLNLA